MKQKLIIGLFLFSLLLINVSALETTQSNPDSFSCDLGVDNCTRIFDNDWATNTFNPGGATGNIYLNYSKPLNVRSAIWDIKIGISAAFAQQTGNCWNGTDWEEIFRDSLSHLSIEVSNRNYSIPDTCFFQESISLQVVMDSQAGKFVHFYEESIRWETDASEIVGFNVTLQLPQMQSPVATDDVGLERTYIYCTWRIDGNGQEAVQMNSTLCPNPQESFTFQNDEDYYRRIDRADIFWNTTSVQWEIASLSIVDSSTIEYILDIPEPPQSIFDSIFNQILSLVRSMLCQIFPSLGFCT